MERGQVWVRGQLPDGSWGNIDAFDMAPEQFVDWIEDRLRTALADIVQGIRETDTPESRAVVLDVLARWGFIYAIEPPIAAPEDIAGPAAGQPESGQPESGTA